MAKSIFINSLDTYIGTALYKEFVGDKPEEGDYTVYGTYFNKESSDKPKGIKKMMKRIKPGLFRKYMLEKFECLIYDMHSGKLADLQDCYQKLTKAPLEAEKVLIVISSVMTWGLSNPKMVEDKPEPKLDDEGNPIVVEEPEAVKSANLPVIEEQPQIADFDPENPDTERPKEPDLIIDEDYDWEDIVEVVKAEGEEDVEQEQEKSWVDEEKDGEGEEKAKPHKIVYVEKEFEIVDEAGEITKVKRRGKKKEKIKEIKLKRTSYNEEDWPSRKSIEQYQAIKEYEDFLLTNKVENLNVYIICAGIPYGYAETVFSNHIKMSWLQNPISLPYLGDGLNHCPTIHVKDLSKIIKNVSEKKPEQKYIFAVDKTVDKTAKNIIYNISKGIGNGKTKSIELDSELETMKFSHEDVYISPKVSEKTNLNLIFTDNELIWPNFLSKDIQLTNSKFIEEEFEWHCKEGIPSNIKKLLTEFCLYRNLRPIKIILNCSDSVERKVFAEKISKAYNIPIINDTYLSEMLEYVEDDLDEEDKITKQKYLDMQKIKNGLIDPEDIPDLGFNPNDIIFEVLKLVLRENVCTNRGYILEGIPINTEEIKKIYWKNVEKKKNPDEEPEPEEPEPDEPEVVENAENEEEVNKEEANPDDPQDPDQEKNPDDPENPDQEKNPDDPENPEQEIKKEPIVPPKKKKKRKYKKFKNVFDKSLLPESVITLNYKPKNESEEDVDNIFWEVENFYQDNGIEILNVIANENREEALEIMRIYIERNERPFNYFKESEDDIHNQRKSFLEEKVVNYQKDLEERGKKDQDLANKYEEEYWVKMEKRIDNIKKDKEKLQELEDMKNRKFLLLNIMPILTRGLLEVCKINPIDPIDYLADFLFKNSEFDD